MQVALTSAIGNCSTRWGMEPDWLGLWSHLDLSVTPEDQDREDMRLLAEGDQVALGRLYDRHSELMLGVGMKMLRDRERAEDIVHDVFVEVWRKAGDYQPERGRVKTWLMVRMRSRCLDRLRRPDVTRRTHRPVGEVQQASASPSNNFEGDYPRVRAALSKLPSDQRTVVSLSYFGGFTSLEISEQLGVPQGTVKSRLRLALASLRSAFAEDTGPKAGATAQ